jgi:gas vesicle protein
MLLGSVVGATVGWLTAPASGEEMRRRLRNNVTGMREGPRIGMDNIESRVRELVPEVSQAQPLP